MLIYYVKIYIPVRIQNIIQLYQLQDDFIRPSFTVYHKFFVYIRTLRG